MRKPKATVTELSRRNPAASGHSKKRLGKRRKYKFDSLQAVGDYFLIPDMKRRNLKGPELRKMDASIRVQAAKQGKARGVRYSVSRTEDGVVVQLEEYLP